MDELNRLMMTASGVFWQLVATADPTEIASATQTARNICDMYWDVSAPDAPSSSGANQ